MNDPSSKPKRVNQEGGDFGIEGLRTSSYGSKENRESGSKSSDVNLNPNEVRRERVSCSMGVSPKR